MLIYTEQRRAPSPWVQDSRRRTRKTEAGHRFNRRMSSAALGVINHFLCLLHCELKAAESCNFQLMRAGGLGTLANFSQPTEPTLKSSGKGETRVLRKSADIKTIQAWMRRLLKSHEEGGWKTSRIYCEIAWVKVSIKKRSNPISAHLMKLSTSSSGWIYAVIEGLRSKSTTFVYFNRLQSLAKTVMGYSWYFPWDISWGYAWSYARWNS